jgi:phage-related protein
VRPGCRSSACEAAKRESARQLQAHGWIGKGVEEIRLRDESGTYRVIYEAHLVDANYVLRVFQKKIMQTSKQDMEIARVRFKQLMRGER